MPILLRPLNDAEYARFAEAHVGEYARQHVNAGEWSAANALDRSRAELGDLLADRLRDGGHEFLSAVDESGQHIGWIWISPAPAFLSDRAGKRWLSQITVEERLRSKGVGGAMLSALHERLALDGARELWLRVYDWNVAARRLYERMGYEVATRFDVDVHMRRKLDPRVRQRPATAADREAIYEIFRAALRPHVIAATGTWDESTERRRHDAVTRIEDSTMLELAGAPVGYLCCKPMNGEMRLIRLMVLPAFQNRGIGSAVLRGIVEDADQCGLAVRLRVLKVNPARRLYERFGFGVVDDDGTLLTMIRPQTKGKVSS